MNAHVTKEAAEHMVYKERRDIAWQLVLTTKLGRDEIVAATGVPKREVARMRGTLRTLGIEFIQDFCRGWFDAYVRAWDKRQWERKQREERLQRGERS